MEDARTLATRYAWAHIGIAYKWGGDDPILGYDCSGFVCELLKGVGKIGRNDDYNAAALYAKFGHNVTTVPSEGCLVFYAATDGGAIIHVEYCIDSFHSIGASGGGSKTQTVADASDQNAFIKMRTIRSRPFIFGFVDPFK